MLLAGLIGLAGPAAATGDDVVVAVAGPMTGQYAAFGEAMLAGARMAMDAADGTGTGRHKVRLLVEDDGCDRAEAVAVAQRLVKQGVALVVGHYCASASIAAAPVYAAAGIVMISPGTNDPLLTDKRAGPTIFRLAHRSDGEGAVSGAYLARHFSGKRVAILHDRTAVGIALADATRKAMNAAGLTEALYSGFIAGEFDYSRLARDLRAYRIDAVYLGAYPSEVDLIRAAVRSDGQSTVIIACHLLADGDIEAATSPKAAAREGLLLATLADAPRLPAASARTAHDRLTANTLAAFQAWTRAIGGDATLAQAVAQAAAALQSGTFPTVLGDVRFDKKGDAEVPFFEMHIWKDGRMRLAP